MQRAQNSFYYRTFVFVFLVFGDYPVFSAGSALTWQQWEHTLTSKKTYEQPYEKVTVKVIFTGPYGESFINYGFWDEGNIFKIRAAFPKAGGWTWQTLCSDKTNKALHNKQGKVRVSSYQGENSLYQKGFLKVSLDRRTLAHEDNTPFLWMGDTGWYTLRESNLEEWRKYIDNRAAKAFTVIQVHVVSSSGTAPNDEGQMPFVNDVPNKYFWQDLETKIAYANQKGLVVYVVGLGVSGKGGYLPAMNTKIFAQYITGRLAGSFVIFSPSMDAHYDKRNDELGTYLKEADSRHLISQHVGTDLHAAEEFHPKEYLDFTSLQSGHHGGNIERAYKAARNWSEVLWMKKPVKPVINTEGVYDGLGNNEGLHWREKDVRKIGWLSWLSGALGYTYGAGNNRNQIQDSKGGVWLFNKDKTSYGYWEKALEWNSAHQMTYMKKFFERIDWWRLQPAPELITNQPRDSVNNMVTAKSAAGDLLVAYLPDNTEIELDMEALARGLSGKWFNPVSGDYVPINQNIKYAGSQKFTRPGEGDWVLLLNK